MNDLTQTQNTETHKWFKAILFAGMMLFAFYASTHMVAAGDTWVAMACGRHFANHKVDTVEPFSFNSHRAGPTEEDIAKWPGWARTLCKPFSLETIQKWHPTGWINQNWLTHLTFYKLASWFGEDGSYNYNTLVYWKFALYFLTVFCVYAVGKNLGAGDFLSAAAACMAMIVGRTFFDIRPAGYSNLLVPAYMLILVLATYRNYRLIWLLIPLIIFWANVHGGYLFAFIMLVPFVGIHLLLRLPRRWSICVGFIGLWLVLYMFSYKFISNTNYLQIQEMLGKEDSVPILFKDKIFIIWAILAIVSVALTCFKDIKSGPFYAYHIGGGFIYFLSLAPRFFLAEIPRGLLSSSKAIYSYFVFSSQMTFLFISLVGALLILVMGLKKDRFVALPVKGIYHTIAAGIVGFIAMIIFNPFHLTNLTHTFEISVSKHAESWRRVNEWKPAFDWMDKTTNIKNPVGSEEAFAVLCILTLTALLVWLLAHFLKPQPAIKNPRRKQAPEMETGTFEWPKVDLAILIISLLALYMAVRSRRFIAIAGSAAAPIVFLMILQIWQMFSARFSWKHKGLLQPTNLNPTLQSFARYGTILVVLGFGIFWTMEYKRIFLDPWPTSHRYHSVFMRMTASYLKPFEVCRFINDNNMNGHIFNYWTEGGAIAFGQRPDSETGQIPLKLFMDGRAQAAYNHDIFQRWQAIHAGGPDGQRAALAKRQMESLRKRNKTNTKEYKTARETFDKSLKKAGPWINSQLRKNDVWVVLMPQNQGDTIFMKALRRTKNWKTGYLDSTQHLLVDSETPQGKTLLNNIIKGTAVFPDVFSKNLTTASVIMETQNPERYKDLYGLIKGAFDESPLPSAAMSMERLTSQPMFREKAVNDLKQYLDDFVKNKDTYLNKHGSLMWLGTAQIAARTLAKYDPERQDRYKKYVDEFRNEAKLRGHSYTW